jgi:hypothetical protein
VALLANQTSCVVMMFSNKIAFIFEQIRAEKHTPNLFWPPKFNFITYKPVNCDLPILTLPIVISLNQVLNLIYYLSPISI